MSPTRRRLTSFRPVITYPTSPAPDAGLLGAPLLYFVEHRRDQAGEVRKYFSSVLLATQLRIDPKGGRQGDAIALYEIYLVDAPKGAIPGRMP